MSMELYLLFSMQNAPNLDEWNRALSERNIPASIAVDVDLKTHSGFLPMRLENKDTGLYFLIEDYDDLAAHFPPLKGISMEDPVVYSLGFGGHMEEGAVVFYSAYVLTVAFNGTAFESQGGSLMNADSLLQRAKLLHQMAGTQ
jgi:hypothetical protein